MELILQSNQPSRIIYKPLVLAVDDDEDNLLLLTEVLTPLSCTVITATYGRQALGLAIEQQPALILLDVMLPDISGVEIVRQLKQNSYMLDDLEAVIQYHLAARHPLTCC